MTHLVIPTETAHLYICAYLVLTIHTTEAERGFRCHDEHSTVKTRERSRLSQERLEQLRASSVNSVVMVVRVIITLNEFAKASRSVRHQVSGKDGGMCVT